MAVGAAVQPGGRPLRPEACTQSAEADILSASVLVSEPRAGSPSGAHLFGASLWHHGCMTGLSTTSDGTRIALEELAESVMSDPAWALRALTEYASHAARGTWELVEDDPGLPRPWNTALAAVSCWAADHRGRPRPAWAVACPAMDPPWDPLESLGYTYEASPLSGAVVPPVMLAKGIRLREKDLWTV